MLRATGHARMLPGFPGVVVKTSLPIGGKRTRRKEPRSPASAHGKHYPVARAARGTRASEPRPAREGLNCQTLSGLPRAARPSGRFAEGKTPQRDADVLKHMKYETSL